MKIDITQKPCGFCGDLVPEDEKSICFVAWINPTTGEEVGEREPEFVVHTHCLEYATREERDALFARKRRETPKRPAGG